MENKYIASRLRRLASVLSEEELDNAVNDLKSIGVPDNLINREGIKKELEEAEDFTIDKMLEMIEGKTFGFIGIHPRVVGKQVIMELEEASFGIDFGDPKDLRKYVENEHEAMDYARDVWKPLIEKNFEGMTAVLPRNTSSWYDWDDEEFKIMGEELEGED